jgi:ABC-type polysaccharide/polyol phosphate export permease
MKKLANEWWFLSAGVAALAVSLILRFVVDLHGNASDFIEGLCIGLSIVFLITGLSHVRREARRDSGRA